MDDRTGEFYDGGTKGLQNVPENNRIYFDIGEIIKIKDHDFEVVRVDTTLHHLVLRSRKRIVRNKKDVNTEAEIKAIKEIQKEMAKSRI